MEFPSALLGVALGTVLLPSLVKQHASENTAEFSALLDWGLRLTLLLTLPAALGLAILATPLIATLFQHGKFDAASVIQTSHALVAYSIGLTGIILVKILAPAFYARQNIRTPVKIAVATLIIVQLSNLAFVPWLKHAGLALSTGLGACVNAGMLYYFMRKQNIYIPRPEWLAFFFKLVVALYLMGGVLLWLGGTSAEWVTMSTVAQITKLLWLVALGAGVYFAGLWIMGIRLRHFSKRAL
jgi:putative peptidoglycan lipid II flippase